MEADTLEEVMRRLTAFVFSISLTSVILAPCTVRSQTVADSARPQIVTSAIGEAQLVPDRAAVYVGVQSRGASAAAAARDNAQRQRAVIDAVSAAGIPRGQISTESYSVTPDTRYDQSTQKTTVAGYVVSNVVRVELRRVDQVAGVIDAALAKGANQINSLDFFSSNADSARHEALVQAIARARADAEVMARAAGGTLGSLIELTTSAEGPRPVFRMAMSNGVVGGAPTPIEPGQQRIQASVSARWRFVVTR